MHLVLESLLLPASTILTDRLKHRYLRAKTSANQKVRAGGVSRGALSLLAKEPRCATVYGVT